MRSELPWLESRSPWHRFGPTLLGLTIIGVGMGGAIRIVKAQDNAAPPAITASADPLKTAAESSQTLAQDDPATSREIEDLLQQRAKLDARISELRQHLRSESRARIGTRAVAPRVEADPTSSDWKRAVEDARSQAREAMQQAREAMRQAQEALREAQRSDARIDTGKGVFSVPAPRMPALPKFNFNGNYDNLNGADAETLKRFQEQWQQKWKSLQPQFEQQMREFQQRMQEWQRSFEAQQRAIEKQLRDQQFRSLDSLKEKAPKSPAEPEEPKAPETSREKGSDGDSDNEPL